MADDAVLAAIEALNARLDRIEARLSDGRGETLDWALDGLSNVRERAPVIVDGAASMATLAMETLDDAGVDPAEAATWAMDVAKKAAGPKARGLVGRALDDDTLELGGKALTAENLALVEKVLDNADLLEFALTAGAAMHDAFLGKDVAALASRAARFAALLEAPEIEAILDSGALGSDGLTVAGNGATALVEAKSAAAPVGPIGAFLKMGDPDVKKAVGFALALAKSFGSRL